MSLNKLAKALGVLSLSCVGFTAQAADYTITKVKEIDVKKPAFLFNFINPNTNEFDLFISSFGPFTPGNVFTINGISNQIQTNDQQIQVTNPLTGLKWPNEIGEVPVEVFGKSTYFTADGFLVPGKGNWRGYNFQHRKQRKLQDY